MLLLGLYKQNIMNTQKNIITGILLFVIGGATGSGVTLLIKDHNASSVNNGQSGTNIASHNTYDPATILKNASTYMGKTVSITGKLGKGSSLSTYYLIGTGSKPTGIRLDFSKSGIDPNKFFVSSSKSVKPAAAGLLTFKGTLSQDKSGIPYLLVISAV